MNAYAQKIAQRLHAGLERKQEKARQRHLANFDKKHWTLLLGAIYLLVMAVVEIRSGYPQLARSLVGLASFALAIPIYYMLVRRPPR